MCCGFPVRTAESGGPSGGRTGTGKGEQVDKLSALIEEGYRLFERPRPTGLGVCVRCCMYPEIEARILDWQVAEIPLEDLRDWYFAASDSPFPRNVMRWFLPRILDLLAQRADLASVGTEVVLFRLRDSGFPDGWTEAEVDFMTRFAEALVMQVARDGGGDERLPAHSLDEVLCMFGMGGVDLGPALARLQALPDAELVRALAPDWGHPGHDIWVNAFWEGGPAKDSFFGWLTSRAMLDRMMIHGSGDAGTPETREKAWHIAEAILRWQEAMDCAE